MEGGTGKYRREGEQKRISECCTQLSEIQARARGRSRPPGLQQRVDLVDEHDARRLLAREAKHRRRPLLALAHISGRETTAWEVGWGGGIGGKEEGGDGAGGRETHLSMMADCVTWRKFAPDSVATACP